MKLTDKIIKIDQIRVNRGLDKLCTCSNRKYMIDTTNKRVLCQSCGSQINAYDAMLDLSLHAERMNEQLEIWKRQRDELINYKPWLLTIRNLERHYRGKKKLPCCPRCDEPFYLEELTRWMGKSFADGRIKKWKKANNK